MHVEDLCLDCTHGVGCPVLQALESDRKPHEVIISTVEDNIPGNLDQEYGKVTTYIAITACGRYHKKE